MTQLVKYEAARNALAAVHTYDEVKDVMDEAERRALYARQANDTELMQWATEIRVRAQRRAGEMLAQTEKSAGSKGVGKSAVPAGNHTPPTLSEMGITKKQSSNWQALASMSPEHFEATVVAAKEAAGEVTTAFMVREAKAEKQRAEEEKSKRKKTLYREAKHPDEPACEGPSDEELRAAEQAAADDLAAAQKLLASDQPLADAVSEVKRLTALCKSLELRITGLMNEKDAAVRSAKAWQRKYEQATKQAA